jgi:serine/threonine protein phosphatase 1
MQLYPDHLFIIGDVHGCYHSFLKLLESWNPNKELLIQVGDLVDRGNFGPECLNLAKEILEKNPRNSVFLRGNHEQLMIDYLLGNGREDIWLLNGGVETLNRFETIQQSPKKWLSWLNEMPLKWENEHVLVSHAGIAFIPDPFDLYHPNGILWNRKPLRDIGKLQIIGHTPQIKGKATYHKSPPHWKIDTGAYRNISLTGLKLNHKGEFSQEINIPTLPIDLE